MEIANLLMAPRTVRYPRRFPHARAIRGPEAPGPLHDERLLAAVVAAPQTRPARGGL
jgi:hypothetical protein